MERKGSQSTNFPTTPGAFATSGKTFVTEFRCEYEKIAADGQSLIYSTYLGGGGAGPGVGGAGISNGGSGSDIGTGIAVDDHDNAWIVGITNSNNFPVTPDAYSLYCEPESTSFDFTSLQNVGEFSGCARFGGGRVQEEQNLQQLSTNSRLIMAAVLHEVRNLCSAIAVVYSNLRERESPCRIEEIKGLENLIKGLGWVASLELHRIYAACARAIYGLCWWAGDHFEKAIQLDENHQEHRQRPRIRIHRLRLAPAQSERRDDLPPVLLWNRQGQEGRAENGRACV